MTKNMVGNIVTILHKIEKLLNFQDDNVPTMSKLSNYSVMTSNNVDKFIVVTTMCGQYQSCALSHGHGDNQKLVILTSFSMTIFLGVKKLYFYM